MDHVQIESVRKARAELLERGVSEETVTKLMTAVEKVVPELLREYGGEMDYEILEAMLSPMINTTERRLRRDARLATAYERFSELENAEIDPPPLVE